MKILYIATEVEPFASITPNAAFIRQLPEYLPEDTEHEIRIIMPRYGIVSERKNRLHEVIRLSNTQIKVADRTEVLKVKVTSIPGSRVQVYFIDNNHYFKRKGIYSDKNTGQNFKDNGERALFFAYAAIETALKLGWQPEVLHLVGQMSALVPYLLKERFAERNLFENAKFVYSPEPSNLSFKTSLAEAQLFGLDLGDLHHQFLTDIGIESAQVLLQNGTNYPFALQNHLLSEEEPAADLFAFYQALTGETA